MTAGTDAPDHPDGEWSACAAARTTDERYGDVQEAARETEDGECAPDDRPLRFQRGEAAPSATGTHRTVSQP
jgi:hypothetical protein